MKTHSFIFCIFAIILIFAVSGCSTVPKKFKEEVAGIKTKMDTLEAKVGGVESRQAEVERVTSEQAQTIEELKAKKERVRIIKTNVSVKPRQSRKKEKTKEIQACLRNAGFYDGEIDGVKGRNTKRAIKEFQKANGLDADGVVGPKTWEALKKYASGAADSAPVPGEGATK